MMEPARDVGGEAGSPGLSRCVVWPQGTTRGLDTTHTQSQPRCDAFRVCESPTPTCLYSSVLSCLSRAGSLCWKFMGALIASMSDGVSREP